MLVLKVIPDKKKSTPILHKTI